MIAFLSPSPLDRLAELARKGKGLVAVPFIGKGASKLLPLQPGSILVTRFDETTVKAGQVDPAEIVRFIRRGVSVHAYGDLHAKVYVFGRRAVVGSANVSSTSKTLAEAAIETTLPEIVRAARDFVRQLAADEIGQAYAESMMDLYPGERHGVARRGKSTGAQGPYTRMWVFPFEHYELDERALVAARAGRPIAERELVDAKMARLDELDHRGQGWIKFAKGDRIVLRATRGRGFSFEPPSRLLHVEAYEGGAILFLERPKRLRERSSTEIRAKLADRAMSFCFPTNNPRVVRAE